MSTPDTEWEKAELAVFWDEIAQHLPKCMERNALGDEKIFQAFATAYPKMKKHLLTSRDTYWKERVRGFRSILLDLDVIGNPPISRVEYTEMIDEALDTLLDNLK